MSIPLDRLYHYIKSLCNDNIVIYRWTPHGSKKLSDLLPLYEFNEVDSLDRIKNLPMVMHDQEPLDYDFFEFQGIQKHYHPSWFLNQSYVEYIAPIPVIRYIVSMYNLHDKFLLCHSEKNSIELDKFDDYFVGVYYWSHALIARDWFRYAEHDCCISNSPIQYKHDFLIYNRAWAGSREYRLKFVELLIENQLVNCSLIKFSPNDNETHYTQHQFRNSKLQISNFSMELSIPDNNASPDASADYVSDDYNTCGVEIVLETLFDDSRHHLTEKTLRAIACGKPFILCSTSGALQYLRDYGFKTFNGLIDESYDTLQDPVLRLESIIIEMNKIKNLSPSDKLKLFSKLNEIAEYNKKLFFNVEWQQSIVNEFILNFKNGYKKIQQYKNASLWKFVLEIVKTDTDFMCNLERHFTAEELNVIVKWVSQNSYQ